MSVAPWWLIGGVVLVALAFLDALTGAEGDVSLVFQLAELGVALGIPMLAAREEGTVWEGARTGALMTAGAARVVLVWGATGLPPFARIDLGPILGLSVAELLALVVAIGVVALVGLVMGTIGGVVGRWRYRRRPDVMAARAAIEAADARVATVAAERWGDRL